MSARGRVATALALPTVVLAFLAGYFSQRPEQVPPQASDIEALHQGLGIDLGGPAASGSPTLSEADVGPVSRTFLAELDSLRSVVEASPTDLAARLDFARLLQDAHRQAEAIEHFERALRENPGERRAWLDLADCYGAQGRWDDVRSAMTRMLAAHPNDPSAAYNMGVAFANVGDLASARAWWTAAVNGQNCGRFCQRF